LKLATIGPARRLNNPLAKAQSPPRKALIMKENEMKDGITRTVNGLEEE